MYNRCKRFSIFLFMMLMIILTFTGCWDSREILDYNILTGSGFDLADDPEQIYITLQVANITQQESSSNEPSTGDNNQFVIFNAVSDTILKGISEININNNHKLMFHHNQIRLFGIDLAKHGVKKYLDMLLRDQQARLEVPFAVVDGRAEDLLSVKLPTEPISGLFLGSMFEDLAKTSMHYKVRLIDFINRILDEGAAPVMPIIKLTDAEEDKKEVIMTGMAVFNDDKMIGQLTLDETLGYIWSLGNVNTCHLEVSDEFGKSILNIIDLSCKRKVTPLDDEKVEVNLSVDAVFTVGELQGFTDMKNDELIKHLDKLAQEQIKETINNAFIAAKNLEADIFGFCTAIHQYYPKKWDKMKDHWNEIFVDIDFNVETKVSISGTGQLVQSLEMEEKME